MSLKDRITLVQKPRRWLNQMAAKYHYMHRPIHCRACPFGWGVEFDGNLSMPDGTPAGFIIFASVHFAKLADEFGEPGTPSHWQVLSLARLWLHDDLPHNSETCTIAKALKKVQRRWLEVHPPRFPDEPYHIRKIISYADTHFHTGTIYRAANFRLSGETVTQARHKTRGTSSGHVLLRFIYDLPEPRWEWEGAKQERLF